MKILFSALAGALIAIAALQFWPDSPAGNAGAAKPLYWVAPMDPDYRRPGPGKSPMGMDLIPVYEAPAAGPGEVVIAPHVEQNLGVRTELAAVRSLEARIRTVGYVGYDEDRLVHLHPRVAGWIETLHVKAEGDPVRAGQPLYSLYSPELVNAQEDLLLALNRGEPRLIESAKSRLRALKLSESTIAELVSRRKVMQTVTYHAPQSGVVEKLAVREGFYVQPDTTLFSIGALDTVWVEADVFARQADRVQLDLPVELRVPHLPGRTFAGRIAYVYPVLDPLTRTLKVRVRIDNAAGLLKPNMFAELVIDGDAGAPALAVPRAAVIRTGVQDRVVRALGQGRFKSVAVRVGRSDGHYLEILEGLQAGDPVVVSAQFLLDSESAKTSDFLRMSPPEPDNEAEVEGLINSVDGPARRVNISRGPVPKWNRAPATLDFRVDPSVAIDALAPGQQIRFRFRALNGEFTLLEIIPAAPQPATNGHLHH